MIDEKTEGSLQTLQEGILKLEQDLARIQAGLQALKDTLAEIIPLVRRRVAFKKASEEVFAEYSYLLQRLSD